MLHELADADGVGLSALGGCVGGGRRLSCGLCGGAGGQAQDHHERQKHCKNLFHDKLLLFSDNS